MVQIKLPLPGNLYPSSFVFSLPKESTLKTQQTVNPTIPNGTSARVMEVIQDDPGVSCQHIVARLGNVDGRQVSNSLAFLRRTHQIKNLGKHALGASWYPTK